MGTLLEELLADPGGKTENAWDSLDFVNPDVKVLSVQFTKVGEKTYKAFPNLEWIIVRQHGFDNVNLEECEKRGIGVVNTKPFAQSTADWINQYIEETDRIALVGYGAIGKKVTHTNYVEIVGRYGRISDEVNTIVIADAGEIDVDKGTIILNGFRPDTTDVIKITVLPNSVMPVEVNNVVSGASGILNSCSANWFLAPGCVFVLSPTLCNLVQCLSTTFPPSSSCWIRAYACISLLPGWVPVTYTLISSASWPSSNVTVLDMYFASALPWPGKCSSVASLLIIFDILSIDVVEPPELTFTTDSLINENCDDIDSGAIYITPSGGTPPYTYLWEGPDVDGDGISEDYSTQDIEGLIPGFYTFLMTDANLCTDSAEFEIIQLTEPDISVVETSETLCFGDSNGFITVDITSGTPPYNFLWTGPGGPYDTQNLTGLTAGCLLYTSPSPRD